MSPAHFDSSFDVWKVHQWFYTSMLILLFPVSSLRSIVGPVPFHLKPALGTKGELFQNQIIQRAIWFLSQAVLKGPFDVDWAGDEHNGKVCAALLSLWHCVFKTFCCYFFLAMPAVAFWESAGRQVGSPSALWECGSLAYVSLDSLLEVFFLVDA